MGDPNWAAIVALAFTLLSALIGVVLWLSRLEGKAATAKETATAAVTAAKEAVTVALAAIKEEALAAEKASLATATAIKEETGKLAQRVTACEAGHISTSDKMNAMLVDMAILRERSDAQVQTLARIESAVLPRPAPRTRATKS